MYHPPAADTEFIEIHNTSSRHGFDLSGYRIDGIGFTFTNGTTISAGGFVVVAENVTAFAAAYSNSASVVGEYGGDFTNKHITTYFRYTLEGTNLLDGVEISFRLLRDDGAVVYLNGTELFRDDGRTAAPEAQSRCQRPPRDSPTRQPSATPHLCWRQLV